MRSDSLNKFVTFGLICVIPRMASTNSANITKSTLRKKMKAVIASIPSELKQLQSETVTSLLKTLPEYQKSLRISVYLNMDDEIRTRPIVEHIFQSGKVCFIPRYSKSDMVMVRLKSMEDLKSLPKTKWNIQQPLETDQREDALETGGLDLVIVPGLAFSKTGDRMGRGKGYYDRFLSICRAKNKNLVTVALAFKEQILENIPTEPHDTKIDLVLFPEGYSNAVNRETILVQ